MAEDFEVGGPLPEESTNRTFIIAAGGLGALLLLSMVCLASYVFLLGPAAQERRIEQATSVPLTNTAIARTQTAEAAEGEIQPTATFTQTPEPLASSTVTPTQVVVLPTDTPFTTLETVVPITETAAAQQTLDAAQQGTPTATPTALPVAGFADDVGVPGLVMLGMLLVVVVIVARQLRLRTSS